MRRMERERESKILRGENTLRQREAERVKLESLRVRNKEKTRKERKSPLLQAALLMERKRERRNSLLR